MGKVKFIALILLIIFSGITLIYAEGQKVDLVPLDSGIKQQIVIVGNIPTPIPTTALSGRKSIMIKNLGSATVYIGNSTVTADTSATGGFTLAQNEVFKGDIGENTIIYGIVVTGSNNISILEAR